MKGGEVKRYRESNPLHAQKSNESKSETEQNSLASPFPNESHIVSVKGIVQALSCAISNKNMNFMD